MSTSASPPTSEEIKKVREEFEEIFKANVKRDGSEDLFNWLNRSDWYTAPASTRFHGSYEGGLLQHSLLVYKNLVRELALHDLTDKYSAESVAIAALFHDLCKVNFYAKEMRNKKIDGQWQQVEVYTIDDKMPLGHAMKSVVILQGFMKLTRDEVYAIAAHMGPYDAACKGGDNYVSTLMEQSKLAFLLHVADMKATYIDGV